MLFPAPLSPTSATVSPGRSSRSSPSSTGSGAVGIGERHLLEPDRPRAPGSARAASRPAQRGGRRVEQREHSLGDRQPVGARVVLGAEPAERQIQLGREHEHGEAGLQPETAGDEPQARRDRDQGNPERRGELENRPREEAHAQRIHRR